MERDEILKKIFSQRGLPKRMRVYKTQFNQGQMTDKLASIILTENGYHKVKEATWRKRKKK